MMAALHGPGSCIAQGLGNRSPLTSRLASGTPSTTMRGLALVVLVVAAIVTAGDAGGERNRPARRRCVPDTVARSHDLHVHDQEGAAVRVWCSARRTELRVRD